MDNTIKDELIDIALLAAIQGLPAELTKRIVDIAIRIDNPGKPEKLAAPKPTLSLQPDLLNTEKSQAEINPIVDRFVRRHALGDVITGLDARNWLEYESGVILTQADKRNEKGKNSPVWRQRVGQRLKTLRDRGFLSSLDANGKPLPKGHFLLVRLP